MINLVELETKRPHPNDYQTWDDLYWQLQRDLNLFGVSYALVLPDGSVERLDPVGAVVYHPSAPYPHGSIAVQGMMYPMDMVVTRRRNP